VSAGDSDFQEGPSLVVTGSSAGGIEALSALVASLPRDFPAPIVVAQHLDPNQPSRLGEILAGRSPLPVVRVTDRGSLQPGTIYVVPAGRDVEITDDGDVIVRGSAERHAQPSVDRLFRTAAESYGERLVGVILSGMGSDGVSGARAVKEHGGTIVIQEPSSATYPSMPLALAPTMVDIVAKPGEMGPVLHDLVTEHVLTEDSSDNALRTFLTQVRDRSGIDFLQYKMPTIRRRLARLMTAAGIETLSDYGRYLQQNPEAYQRLVSAFLIKVTGFFRDPPLFDYLREQLMPQLIEEARDRERELRLWSAGCATGEEAYSLAVMIAELLRDEAEPFNIRIFATDLDDEAITFARRGIYPHEAFEHVPEELVDRYFVRLDDAYEVGKRIRNMTVFGQHDLGQRAPFPRIDLALCRNVLIYFTRELQHRALQMFAFSVRENGYLVLGKAEMTSPAPEFFKPVHTLLKVFRRQGERALIPATQLRDTLSPAPPPIPKRIVSSVGIVAGRSIEARPSYTGLVGTFIFNSEIGIVIVDRRYDVVSINAAGRTMLNVHGVGIGEDLIHLVRNIETNALRDMIDAALRNEIVEFGREVVVRTGATEPERYLQIACYPDRSIGSARIETVVLLILDATAPGRRRKQLEQRAEQQEAEISNLTARLEEVTQRQRALLDANDELTTANVELRNMNEQLLIASEEAASSTEEIETLNEEMQATNEELETLNEELQATVEELNTTNDELEARGRELEDLSRAREASLFKSESEREKLSHALHAFDDPLALVGADGKVDFQNAAFAAISSVLSLGDGARPTPLGDIAKLFAGQTAEKTLSAAAAVDGKKLQYSATLRAFDVGPQRFWLLQLRSVRAS
jgi:two-component system, chemotaxis family, CheB/CheR fusion protein